MESIKVDRKAIEDLIRLREEFNLIIESLELMGNEEFMNSYNKAKEQIKKREFADWDGLQNSSN